MARVVAIFESDDSISLASLAHTVRLTLIESDRMEGVAYYVLPDNDLARQERENLE